MAKRENSGLLRPKYESHNKQRRLLLLCRSLAICLLTIPIEASALTFKSDGSVVQKSGEVASSKELFVLTEVDKDELFMGEQVTVTYKLYTRVQLGLEKIDYPKSVGFWQEDLSIPQPVSIIVKIIVCLLFLFLLFLSVLFVFPLFFSILISSIIFSFFENLILFDIK